VVMEPERPDSAVSRRAGLILKGSNGSILLKKSEIEVPRKSRFRAQSVVSTDSCHSKA
jgi:hypothetical protein